MMPNEKSAPIAGLEPMVSVEGALLAQAQDLICRNYTGIADQRLANMGIFYIIAERRDLSNKIAAFAAAHAAEQVRAEREVCASIIDARCAEVLSRQYSDDPPPTEFEQSVNTNLRLTAALLPDLSAAIRARGQS